MRKRHLESHRQVNPHKFYFNFIKKNPILQASMCPIAASITFMETLRASQGFHFIQTFYLIMYVVVSVQTV